jgi:hypothetical protein
MVQTAVYYSYSITLIIRFGELTTDTRPKLVRILIATGNLFKLACVKNLLQSRALSALLSLDTPSYRTCAAPLRFEGRRMQPDGLLLQPRNRFKIVHYEDPKIPSSHHE